MARARILVSGFYFCLSFRRIPDKHEVYDKLASARTSVISGLLYREKKRKKAKFIKINGPIRPAVSLKLIFYVPFKPSMDWRDPFTFASSLYHSHDSRRAASIVSYTRLFLAWKRNASSDRRCIQVWSVHWFSFLRSAGLNVSYLFIPAPPLGRSFLFYDLSSR